MKKIVSVYLIRQRLPVCPAVTMMWLIVVSSEICAGDFSFLVGSFNQNYSLAAESQGYFILIPCLLV